MQLGVDTGGTFTDFVLLQTAADGQIQLTTHKVLSTPHAPEEAILQGIADLGLQQAIASGKVRIVHGSTVATNAALEHKGVKTAFITNEGFGDMLTIARQTRPALYRLEQPAVPVPVPAHLCLETKGRVSANGELLDALNPTALDTLIAQLEATKPDAIAICLLFSFLNAEPEQTIVDALHNRLSWTPFICHSAAVLPEYREYERGIATWLNATLGPLMARYLRALAAQTAPSPLAIMQSSGGTIAADQAADNAIHLLLSGPAGGLAAVHWLARQRQQERFLTFDMGGTSTDVALYDNAIALTSEGRIGSWPVAVPMIDMHTIGAGGGSLAWIDQGGLLQVGPRSAGASPGPACYGSGGVEATVTDANLVLGRLYAPAGLGSQVRLDLAAATEAIRRHSQKLGLTDIALAEGIITLANEHMAQALRMMSVARGYDPKTFTLCCFGGAGGLHVCALAEELGMTSALIPPHGGVFSALGMLLAPASRELSHALQCPLSQLDKQQVPLQIENMTKQGQEALAAEGHKPDQMQVSVSADLRYLGQSSTLNVVWQNQQSAGEAFEALHQARYGHRLGSDLELVNIRVSVHVFTSAVQLPQLPSGAHGQPVDHVNLPGLGDKVPVYRRETLSAGQNLQGPALIVDTGATCLLYPNWAAKVEIDASLALTRQ